MSIMWPKNGGKDFPLGTPVFEWDALDYPAIKRGWLWYSLFCGTVFGTGLWAILTDPQWGWLTAFCFFVVAAIYFWKHQHGPKQQTIFVFTKGIKVGPMIIDINDLSGYWILQKHGANCLVLEPKNPRQSSIKLQMGDQDAEFFRQSFAATNLPEITDAKEGLLDLWIRALKL